MARQKVEDNLFYVLFRRIPTWATAATVTASYPVLRYLLPALTHGSLWALIGSAFAPWLTFALALIALYTEADKYQRRQLLKQQSSLETLRGLTWQEFELLVGEAYRRQGYSVEETGGSGPDGGVDLVLRRTGETVLVQCKRWKQQAKVGAPTVRRRCASCAAQWRGTKPRGASSSRPVHSPVRQLRRRKGSRWNWWMGRRF